MQQLERYPSPPKRCAFWMENSAYVNEWLIIINKTPRIACTG